MFYINDQGLWTFALSALCIRLGSVVERNQKEEVVQDNKMAIASILRWTASY